MLCLVFYRSLPNGPVRSHCKYHRRLQDRWLFPESISNEGHRILPRRNARQTKRPAGDDPGFPARYNRRLASRGYCTAQVIVSIMEYRHPYRADRHGQPRCCSRLHVPTIPRPSPGVPPPEQRTVILEHTVAGSASTGHGAGVGSMVRTPWMAALLVTGVTWTRCIWSFICWTRCRLCMHGG